MTGRVWGVAALLCVACAVAPTVVTAPPGLLAPDGSVPDSISCDHPLVITGSSDRDAVDAEYQWLNAHFPRHSMVSQAFGIQNGHYYDTLRFRTAEGHDASVCFDFTAVPHTI